MDVEVGNTVGADVSAVTSGHNPHNTRQCCRICGKTQYAVGFPSQNAGVYAHVVGAFVVGAHVGPPRDGATVGSAEGTWVGSWVGLGVGSCVDLPFAPCAPCGVTQRHPTRPTTTTVQCTRCIVLEQRCWPGHGDIVAEPLTARACLCRCYAVLHQRGPCGQTPGGADLKFQVKSNATGMATLNSFPSVFPCCLCNVTKKTVCTRYLLPLELCLLCSFESTTYALGVVVSEVTEVSEVSWYG